VTIVNPRAEAVQSVLQRADTLSLLSILLHTTASQLINSLLALPRNTNIANLNSPLSLRDKRAPVDRLSASSLLQPVLSRRVRDSYRVIGI
jgi:hypothetical protein